ncbi:MAG: two-component sensor histidine kinase [Chloroflexi bacterium HGW-Chloroflexi-4]|jgi:histidine kinase|nr:MAG: two-component sensor histidine kinase [Chloroflexi bacterium HGW-Chloroflexi-4]
MLSFIRKHLSWKLFVSYVIVIIIGVVVLATATSVSIPTAFSRHMSGMSAMMLNNPTMGSTQSMETKLFVNYKAAVTEALSLATIIALLAAVVASFLISRQVVEPIQRLMKLSRKIAAGEYEERLQISGNVQGNQLDELDQLALSFNQMADKLEKTESMRRQLIGDVTHEMRTPLSAIKGYMEGLIDGVISATPETYNQVYAEADRLQRLVNDLQELSRVEAGTYQLKIESATPTLLVETVVNNFNRQFDEKGLILKHTYEANLPKVSVDKDRIVQVLTNLVGNALQYTPTGGVVTISVSRVKNEVNFEVTDTGIGISPEHLSLIFNRFYRTDKSRTRASGGSGIGLTIAQALVKAHHGRIWVKSAGEGEGTSIYFTLPISELNSK